MLEHLSPEEFLELSGQNKPIIVFREISLGSISPISAFYSMNYEGQRKSVLLESGFNDPQVGRFSLLGFDPYARFSSKSGLSESLIRGKAESLPGDAFDHLRNVLLISRCANSARLPPLAGGAIGFIAYGAIRIYEKIPDRHPDIDQVPDILFHFYETTLLFDHLSKKITISVIVEPGNHTRQTYEAVQTKIDRIIQEISTPKPFARHSGKHLDAPSVDASDIQYCEMVEKAKQHLLSGDAFQIVLSRCFSYPVTAPSFDIYRALRKNSLAPFMFYIQDENFELLGASPERLVRLENGIVETMPIAGTRLRGKPEDDERIEKELLSDKKELCEHVMLVDLGRNDIGKISKPGSVVIKKLKSIKRFSNVIHIVSLIEGQLDERFDAIDVIKALFPAGTLTGAPKIRAMEIIDALEGSRRGVYGGAIYLIDNKGNLDSCIAIRSAFIKNHVAKVRAGAGIILESDPMSEAQETRIKAETVLQAIRLAEEGLI